jgi:hypothetical protein
VFSCAECGFDSASMTEGDLVNACESFVRRFRAPLTRFLPGEDGGALLRRRPAPEVWSALEYAAHTRDVLGFYRGRIERVLAEDRPTLEYFGFAEACEERRYNDEDPATVAEELAREAAGLAATLRELELSAWRRVGLASDGSGAERTVRALAERAVHDADHHLLDIGRSLRAARAR